MELISISNIVTILITVLLTIVVYQLSKVEKNLVYDLVTIPISLEGIRINEKMKFYYDDAEINSLVISKVSFCNVGKKTISSDDVPKSEPLRIELVGDNVQLLDSYLIYESRKITNFSSVQDKNKIVIQFDFIDKNDGAILQLLHSNSDNYRIEVNGIVKGNRTKKIQRQYESNWMNYYSKNIIERMLPKNTFLGIVVFLILLPFNFIINMGGYSIEMLVKFNKRLPREFRLSFK